jgi:hypothetical protein
MFKNGVNEPPSVETKISYEAMLVAPGPGDPLQLTVKLGLVETAGSEFTVLVGVLPTNVVAWAVAGVGCSRPTLSVATL